MTLLFSVALVQALKSLVFCFCSLERPLNFLEPVMCPGLTLKAGIWTPSMPLTCDTLCPRDIYCRKMWLCVIWTASSWLLGIYFYNGHPIRRVDIMGTVVGVREKDALYSYAGKSNRLWNWVYIVSPHSAECWSLSSPHVCKQPGASQNRALCGEALRVPCLGEVSEATGKKAAGGGGRRKNWNAAV